jgi:hypothetical protein
MLRNFHNHPSNVSGTFPVHRRQQREAQPEIRERILADKAVNTISAKESYIAVQQQYPGLDIEISDIFNIQAQEQYYHDEGLPAVQAMARDLGDAYHFHYSVNEHYRLVNLVFLQKTSLYLLRRWPYTIILDATYHTNKFGLYLVDIVGMTGSSKTFIIGQAFLSAEGEEDYTFILQWLQDLYVEAGLEMPITIVTDKAGGLICALKKVFPTSHHILCIVHINRDVLTYCKTHWRDELVTNVDRDSFTVDSDKELPVDPTTTDTGLISVEERESYMDTHVERFLPLCNTVVNAPSIPAHKTAWNDLQRRYAEYPKIISYLERIWIPFRENFCKAWLNNIPHFGNTTSNRAEGSHRGVKRKIPKNRLHVRKVVDIMKTYLKYINKDHLKDINRDRSSIGDFFKRPCFHKLRYRITVFAIKKVEEHLAFFKEKDQSALPKCTGIFSRTWGVPCPHKVYAKDEAVEMLEVADFHQQWRIIPQTDLLPLDPALLLRDPVIVRDPKSRGKKAKTGRVLSAFEVINEDILSQLVNLNRRRHHSRER